MREVTIGDFVETIHDINGILTAVKRGYYGLTAFIATADGRTFYCPVGDLKDCTQVAGFVYFDGKIFFWLARVCI